MIARDAPSYTTPWDTIGTSKGFGLLSGGHWPWRHERVRLGTGVCAINPLGGWAGRSLSALEIANPDTSR